MIMSTNNMTLTVDPTLDEVLFISQRRWSSLISQMGLERLHSFAVLRIGTNGTNLLVIAQVGLQANGQDDPSRSTLLTSFGDH